MTERFPSHEPREQLSNESVDTGGSQHSVHVFVVDDAGDPVTGQDVAAHFSDTGAPGTWSHQYTDVESHAEFLLEHAAEPRHGKIVVRGQSFGPYTVEEAGIEFAYPTQQLYVTTSEPV